MKSLFTADLVSYSSQLNVVEQIKAGIPATFSLCIGAAIIWLFFGILVGSSRPSPQGGGRTVRSRSLALIGISLPVFWLGLIVALLLRRRTTRSLHARTAATSR